MLTSLRHAQIDPDGADRVLRRAMVGDVALWFSFRVTLQNEIAQIYWG